MQKPVRIFVEGIADEKFLKDYVSYIIPEFKKVEKESVIESGGWTNKREDSKIEMQKNTDNGGVNLVIFDADDDCEKRRQELEEWKASENLSFEIFLFPNDADTGALEDLLERIIQEKNQPIFDCWQGYEKCLESKTIEGRTKPLTTPAKKTKIYGYMEALLGTTKREKDKIKEKERDYRNADHWNLDSDKLNPLKEFFKRHIV